MCVLTNTSQEHPLPGKVLIEDRLLHEIEVSSQNMILLRRYQELEPLKIIKC